MMSTQFVALFLSTSSLTIFPPQQSPVTSSKLPGSLGFLFITNRTTFCAKILNPIFN
ncbi:hypothetical protein ACJW31_12G175700 [Castanea mollissima]